MSSEPTESTGTTDHRRQTDKPWAHVVKPNDSEPSITQDDENANATAAMKKTAWNKPSSNGVVGEPVMGAESWPPLSESTRVSPKSVTSSNDSSLSKPTPNGSASTSSQKHGSPDANPKAAVSSPRPRPTKRGGGGNFAYNHGRLPPPPPPPLPTFPIYQMPPNGYGILAPVPLPPLSPDTSPRDLQFRGGFRGRGGFGNDHRGSNRKGNYGSRSHGEGSKRDQDGPPRGYIRHPHPHPHHNSMPFMPMPPVRPFMHPMGYPEFQYFPGHMDPYRGVQVVPPQPHGVMIPGPEPVSAILVRQIEYYFSDENLLKDNYLKSNMDDQGWVPVSLIAGFPRVKKLMADINQNNNSVDNIQFILDSLRPSINVEVQDEKLRRRNEWMKWVNTSSGLPVDTGSKSSDESNRSLLENSLKKMEIGEGSASQDIMTVNSDTCSEAIAGGCMPKSTGQSSLPNGEYTKDSAPSRD